VPVELELELLPGEVAPGGVPLVLELVLAGLLALLLLFPGFAALFPPLFACLIGPLLELVLKLADASGAELPAAGGVAVLEGLPSCQA
jgi:hypothetical protein